MKNVIYFFAGIVFTAFIAATTATVMTFKPAAPSKEFSFISQASTVSKRINEYELKGYNVKCMTSLSGKYHNNEMYVIVIMVKY